MSAAKDARRRINEGQSSADVQAQALAAVADALLVIADEMAKSRDVAMHALTDQQADELEKRWGGKSGSARVDYGLFANPDPRAV